MSSSWSSESARVRARVSGVTSLITEDVIDIQPGLRSDDERHLLAGMVGRDPAVTGRYPDTAAGRIHNPKFPGAVSQADLLPVEDLGSRIGGRANFDHQVWRALDVVF